MPQLKTRPPFEAIKTSKDFTQWYWLKAELVTFCKTAKLPYGGSKTELTECLAFKLDNPNKVAPIRKKVKTTSKFNWAKADLKPQTIITDSYTNGPNSRRFFR